MKPDRSHFESNIIKYYINVFLFEMSLWSFLVIHIVFLQQFRALSLTGITIIGAVYWVTSCVAEIPTGLVADRFSRKLSLCMGSALTTISILGYGLAPDFLWIVLSNVLLSVALSFQSGADEAFFYETLKALGRETAYTQMAGRASAVARAGMVAGSIMGGWLASAELLYPFFMGAVLHLLSLAVCLTYKEPPKELNWQGSKRRGYVTIVVSAIDIMKQKRELRYAMIYSAIIPILSFEFAAVFIQPQVIALGVPMGAMGFIIMGMHLSKAAGVAFSYWFKDRFGERKILYAVPFLLLLCMVVVGVYQHLACLWIIALFVFATDIAVPVINHIIQRQVFDEIRATLMSVRSIVFSLLIAVTEPVLGITADNWSLSGIYFVSAGMLFFFFVWLVKIRKQWLR